MSDLVLSVLGPPPAKEKMEKQRGFGGRIVEGGVRERGGERDVK